MSKRRITWDQPIPLLTEEETAYYSKGWLGLPHPGDTESLSFSAHQEGAGTEVYSVLIHDTL